MCRSYLFKVAALSCQNPLQAAPEPGTGNCHLRRVNRLNFFNKKKIKKKKKLFEFLMPVFIVTLNLISAL